MKVKEVVSLAAEFVGVGDVLQAHFSAASEEGEVIENKLLQCFHVVENEVAIDFLPLIAEDEINSSTGVILFSELTKKAVRILKVMDESGEAVKCEVHPQYVKTLPGRLTVRYAYAPEQKTLTKEVEAHSSASVRLLAYGVASAYCLNEGLYEEGAVWEKKYKQAVLAAYKASPAKVMRSRRWV